MIEASVSQLTPREKMQDYSNTRPVALEVRNLCKRFGDSYVVNHVSFEVAEGEFVFLIGPSGCGKTTTLRMIGGYETPSSGDVLIRGRSMNRVPLDKRNVGMVFQNYALFPHMTIRRNVEFGLRIRKRPRAERRDRVDATLELVKLRDFADRYPAQLSGGQRQRVALARVIAYEPDILLLDEPLANLDKRLRDAMRVELKKLQEKVGITTLYVTHDQEEALTMADRIMVLDQGNLLQVGSPKQVYNSPKTAFVATFLGETSSFRGQVDSISNELAHITIEGGLRASLLHSGDDLAVGDTLVASIRPERVRLSRQPPQQQDNAFAGIVDFVSYAGSYVVYIVRSHDRGIVIRASEPIPSGYPSFGEGDKVFAFWDPGHAVYVRE
jgi:spermidine/putrescine ABC transporter ATP-binding subunit